MNIIPKGYVFEMKKTSRLVNTMSEKISQLPRSISALDSMVHRIPSSVYLPVPIFTPVWRRIEQIVDGAISHDDIIRSELREIREAISRIYS